MNFHEFLEGESPGTINNPVYLGRLVCEFVLFLHQDNT